MNRYLVILFCICFVPDLAATHNRAGEITYQHLSGYTFEFMITTYTYAPSMANRDRLTIHWGDGTYQVIYRVLSDTTGLDNDYLHNQYKGVHTFPGPGVYVIYMEDPNRNLGIKNIPNSVNTIFSIKTTMMVGPISGANSTPVLLTPPIDKAAKDHVFYHNPGAYDADGDSISYELTSCTGANGIPLPGYILPPASDTILIDQMGNLIWDTPIDTGAYNIAMFVDEWRNGVRISRIARDMQIDVYNTGNNPPVLNDISDYCVKAGDTITFRVICTDEDNDYIKLDGIGGPMEVSQPAIFDIDSVARGYTSGLFTWVTTCAHARQQSYSLIFKAVDIIPPDSINDISLVDLKQVSIRVLHNAPTGLLLSSGVDSIRLKWDVSNCGTPAGYNIYRHINASTFSPDSCENGVPAYTGFEYIGKTEGKFTTTFTDDNNGQGLVPGYDYCYRVTAYYKDNAESFASDEQCATLISGTPPILGVSVEENSPNNGKIRVTWARPLGIDTLSVGPFRYDVLRKAPRENDFQNIYSVETIDLTDTTYLDEGINTLVYPYQYSVHLLYQQDGQWVLLPDYEEATSTYLSIKGAGNKLSIESLKRAPWLNKSMDVYKQNQASDFDSIGTSSTQVYTDSNLVNGIPYTYFIRTASTRPLFGGIYNLTNQSHLGTGIPIDTVPPCVPPLSVFSVCEDEYNQLLWNTPFDVCGDKDVVYYNIYYKEQGNADLERIDSIIDPAANSYQHFPENRLAGCYAVTAVDTFYNESAPIEVCVDSCTYYILPNVFTPNNDGENDIYRAYNLGGFIKRVDMVIFNRFGHEVFKTNDPYINWDGHVEGTGKLAGTGVYYYVCDVYEPRITGERIVTLTGFIHVFAGDTNAKYTE